MYCRFPRKSIISSFLSKFFKIFGIICQICYPPGKSQLAVLGVLVLGVLTQNLTYYVVNGQKFSVLQNKGKFAIISPIKQAPLQSQGQTTNDPTPFSAKIDIYFFHRFVLVVLSRVFIHLMHCTIHIAGAPLKRPKVLGAVLKFSSLGFTQEFCKFILV